MRLIQNRRRTEISTGLLTGVITLLGTNRPHPGNDDGVAASADTTTGTTATDITATGTHDQNGTTGGGGTGITAMHTTLQPRLDQLHQLRAR